MNPYESPRWAETYGFATRWSFLLTVIVAVVIAGIACWALGYGMGLQDGSLHGMDQLREVIQER